MMPIGVFSTKLLQFKSVENIVKQQDTLLGFFIETTKFVVQTKLIRLAVNDTDSFQEFKMRLLSLRREPIGSSPIIFEEISRECLPI